MVFTPNKAKDFQCIKETGSYLCEYLIPQLIHPYIQGHLVDSELPCLCSWGLEIIFQIALENTYQTDIADVKAVVLRIHLAFHCQEV